MYMYMCTLKFYTEGKGIIPLPKQHVPPCLFHLQYYASDVKVHVRDLITHHIVPPTPHPNQTSVYINMYILHYCIEATKQ